MIFNEKKTVSFRKTLVVLTAALGLAATAAPALAAGAAKHPRSGGFSFEGRSAPMIRASCSAATRSTRKSAPRATA